MNMIFEKDDGLDSESGGTPRISRAQVEESEKKRVILTIAVVAVTVIIVTAWLLTLPMQLEKFEILDDESVARWHVIREEVDREAGTIQGQLDLIKEQIDIAATELEITSGRGNSDESGVSAAEMADILRKKMMEAESNNETEKDATQEE
jgi:hypothetical protein